jgi:hypothetical protein
MYVCDVMWCDDDVMMMWWWCDDDVMMWWWCDDDVMMWWCVDDVMMWCDVCLYVCMYVCTGMYYVQGGPKVRALLLKFLLQARMLVS